MFVLCFKGNPTTFAQIHKRHSMNFELSQNQERLFICGSSKKSVQDRFIYYAGWSWGDHEADGYSVEIAEVMLNPRSKAAAEVVKRARRYAKRKEPSLNQYRGKK